MQFGLWNMQWGAVKCTVEYAVETVRCTVEYAVETVRYNERTVKCAVWTVRYTKSEYSVLHSPHTSVFSGQAGQWQFWFTREQAKNFDAQLRRQLGRPSIKANL